MPRTLVLDLLDNSEDDIRTALAKAGPEFTWTRDPVAAGVLFDAGRIERLVVAFRTLPPDRLAPLVARAARSIDVHVLMTHPNPLGIRALLKLGVSSMSAGHGAAEAAVRGLSLVEPLPARLQPTDAVPCEVRVIGRVLELQSTPPALVVELPLDLPVNSDVEVIDGLSTSLGRSRVKFRVEAPTETDPGGAAPDVWRLVPDDEVALEWDFLMAKVREGGLDIEAPAVVPDPWNAAANIVISVPARWCGVDGDGLELLAQEHIRHGAMIEIVGIPGEVTAPSGVFGRIIRVDGTSSPLLRCERVPAGTTGTFTRRGRPLSAGASMAASSRPLTTNQWSSASVSAPARAVAPASAPATAPKSAAKGGRQVEPAMVISILAGLAFLLGVAWIALNEKQNVVPEGAIPGSSNEVFQAMRDAFK